MDLCEKKLSPPEKMRHSTLAEEAKKFNCKCQAEFDIRVMYERTHDININDQRFEIVFILHDFVNLATTSAWIFHV